MLMALGVRGDFKLLDNKLSQVCHLFHLAEVAETSGLSGARSGNHLALLAGVLRRAFNLYLPCSCNLLFFY